MSWSVDFKVVADDVFRVWDDLEEAEVESLEDGSAC